MTGNSILSTALADSCFNTVSGDIVIIKFIEEVPESSFYKLHCDCFLEKTDYFREPIESSKIGIYKVSRTEQKNICSSIINKKCLLLPNFNEENTFICIPFVNMTLCH